MSDTPIVTVGLSPGRTVRLEAAEWPQVVDERDDHYLLRVRRHAKGGVVVYGWVLAPTPWWAYEASELQVGVLAPGGDVPAAIASVGGQLAAMAHGNLAVTTRAIAAWAGFRPPPEEQQ